MNGQGKLQFPNGSAYEVRNEMIQKTAEESYTLLVVDQTMDELCEHSLQSIQNP